MEVHKDCFCVCCTCTSRHNELKKCKTIQFEVWWKRKGKTFNPTCSKDSLSLIIPDRKSFPYEFSPSLHTTTYNIIEVSNRKTNNCDENVSQTRLSNVFSSSRLIESIPAKQIFYCFCLQIYGSRMPRSVSTSYRPDDVSVSDFFRFALWFCVLPQAAQARVNRDNVIINYQWDDDLCVQAVLGYKQNKHSNKNNIFCHCSWKEHWKHLLFLL